MDDYAIHILTGLIAVGIGLMPFYNAFIERQKMKKDETDQFHARINELVKQAAYTEGYRQGGVDKLNEIATLKGILE